MLQWPDWLVALVRAVKHGMGFFSTHSLMGVTLDLPVRFVLLGGLYLMLQRWLRRRYAAVVVVSILLGTELFEIFGVRNPFHPVSPNRDDLLDILSGLAGLATAELFRRVWGHASRSRRER